MTEPRVEVTRTGVIHAVDYLGNATGRARCGWRFLHPSTAVRVLRDRGPITCEECQ